MVGDKVLVYHSLARPQIPKLLRWVSAIDNSRQGISLIIRMSASESTRCHIFHPPSRERKQSSRHVHAIRASEGLCLACYVHCFRGLGSVVLVCLQLIGYR